MVNPARPLETIETPKTLPSIALPCPLCGEPLASISLHLNSLDESDGDNFTCNECENNFSVESVRGFLARWGKILAWLEQAPELPE